ncbi:MAG: urease accessory protein UreH, partial [Armatimonadota bacterium]|nr:urease accessory protein UreH [Armatimonadota bacterium]
MSFALLLGAAFVLGVRHALDPDHLVAVSTLVAEERRLWPAARLGLWWGAGHLLPIAAVGLPLLALRVRLPEAWEHTVDLGVGVLLVVLGLRTLWALRRERVHFHVH